VCLLSLVRGVTFFFVHRVVWWTAPLSLRGVSSILSVEKLLPKDFTATDRAERLDLL
jgi:hypothetical protein